MRKVLATIALVFAVVVAGNAFPATAEAAPKKSVKVCLLKDYGLSKSWSKGLKKEANKAFRTHVKVKWIREDHWSNCNVIVWGDDSAYDYENDTPVSALYSVSYDEGHHTHMVNVASGTPKAKRVPVLIKALKKAGIR